MASKWSGRSWWHRWASVRTALRPTGTRGMVSGKKVSGQREAVVLMRERQKLKASAKYVTRSREFKALLEKRRGWTDVASDPVDTSKPPLPKTPQSEMRRRLRTLRGRTLHKEESEKLTVSDFASRVGAQPQDIAQKVMEIGDQSVSITTELSEEACELLAAELAVKIERVKTVSRDRERTVVTDYGLYRSFPYVHDNVLRKTQGRRPRSGTYTGRLLVLDCLHPTDASGGDVADGRGTADAPADLPFSVLRTRSAVVTVMGHVDHGKTTLIDFLRKSNVVAKEKGGITQSIGSFLVRMPFDGRTDSALCIIDTPGHEAFAQMRERGANVTDIVVLVVAADDGPLATTREAINQAKRAGAALIVAINKIDAPNADPASAKAKLFDIGVKVEELGGDVQCVEISALHGTNVEQLVEATLLQAELLDLHADTKCLGEAVCIESKKDVHLGSVANAIVRWGTVRRGDFVVAGTTWGRVRTLVNDVGTQVSEAGPSTPVAIASFRACPPAGSDILVVKDEHEAKRVAALRERMVDIANMQKTVEGVKMEDIKTDVQGSLDAILFAIEQLKNEGRAIQVVHSAVGMISERDVADAGISGAVLLGFNVRATQAASFLARQRQGENPIVIRSYDIIYRLLEDVEKLCRIKTQPKTEEVRYGLAKVQKLFDFGKKIGLVLGCLVTEGVLNLRNRARILRNDEVIFDGQITTMKHIREDVLAMKAGSECGIGIAGASSVQEGDVIEAYEVKDVVPEEF